MTNFWLAPSGCNHSRCRSDPTMMAYSSGPSVSEPSVAMRLRNAGATPPEKPGSTLTSIPIFKISYPGILAPIVAAHSNTHHGAMGTRRIGVDERNSSDCAARRDRIIALGDHPYQFRPASASLSSFVLAFLERLLANRSAIMHARGNEDRCPLPRGGVRASTSSKESHRTHRTKNVSARRIKVSWQMTAL